MSKSKNEFYPSAPEGISVRVSRYTEQGYRNVYLCNFYFERGKNSFICSGIESLDNSTFSFSVEERTKLVNCAKEQLKKYKIPV